MASRALPTDHLSPRAEQALAALDEARDKTLELVAHLGEEELEAVHSPIMSPLVWDLGHIAAYEDLWICHRHGGMELARGELAALYDAFETPRAVRGKVDKLGPAEARDYMAEVRERAVRALAERGTGDGLIVEMVIRHELQHTETMRQTMAIAGLLRAGEGALEPVPGVDRWISFAAGACSLGAGPDGFAYDNERPRHTLELDAFQIAARPVTNASWMSFSEGGGYERREWWSNEGWAWKEEYDTTHHPAVAAGIPDAPVCHVSWFEADAFARAHHARLPTEMEWERASTSGQLAGMGRVWEWTASDFLPYPGFRAHPYREYSEVFFGDRHRVLRGSSWATDPRIATPSFRNWDLPQRRQIFAGLRLARELA